MRNSFFSFLSCRNGDGYIDRDEFALIIRSSGESITEDEVDELMRDGDKNNDGMLDFDGNSRHFTGHKSLYQLSPSMSRQSTRKRRM